MSSVSAEGQITHANDSFTRGFADLGPTATPAATTTVEATPAYVGRGVRQAVGFSSILGDSEARVTICAYDWPCEWAVNTMLCESSGDPNAYNSAGHVGLFQVDPVLHGFTIGELYDPATNIEAAYAIYLSEGPGAWPWCG